MRRLVFALISSLSAVLGAAAAGAAPAPAMIIGWEETSLPTEQCVERVILALRTGGFIQDLQVGGPAVFANAGDYAIAVRCVVAKTMVMFATAGPNSERAAEAQAKVKAAFAGK